MLDFVYYPISFILWCWHAVFGAVFGDASALAWALAVAFLVCTLRAALLRPAVAQARFMRRMRQLGPALKEIRRKYADDRVTMSTELQRLFSEHRVSPLVGYLPTLLQLPVFFGLNHVLRAFTETSGGNYVFSSVDVQSFLTAKLFGAHLGDAIVNTGLTGGAAEALLAWHVAPVAVPLIVLAAAATHLTARLAVSRQLAAGAATEQQLLLGRVTMYLVPAVVLLFGAALPVGLLIYWVSNNAWTLVQQHFLVERAHLP